MKQCELVAANTLVPLPASVTLCATVDEGGNERVITDMMIRRACEMMDGTQIWPCGEKASITDSSSADQSAEIIPFASSFSR